MVLNSQQLAWVEDKPLNVKEGIEEDSENMS
jgi:hypothetical protein